MYRYLAEIEEFNDKIDEIFEEVKSKIELEYKNVECEIINEGYRRILYINRINGYGFDFNIEISLDIIVNHIRSNIENNEILINYLFKEASFNIDRFWLSRISERKNMY